MQGDYTSEGKQVQSNESEMEVSTSRQILAPKQKPPFGGHLFIESYLRVEPLVELNERHLDLRECYIRAFPRSLLAPEPRLLL